MVLHGQSREALECRTGRFPAPSQSIICVTKIPRSAPRAISLSFSISKKSLEPLRFQGFLWQRVKDSNPHIQSQSLLCYPYTNPLFLSAAQLSTAANRYYYTEKRKIVNRFFEKSFFFFLLRPHLLF